MKELIKRLLHDEDGATIVEYALMAVLIAVVCIVAVTTLGTAVKALFQSINDAKY